MGISDFRVFKAGIQNISQLLNIAECSQYKIYKKKKCKHISFRNQAINYEIYQELIKNLSRNLSEILGNTLLLKQFFHICSTDYLMR